LQVVTTVASTTPLISVRAVATASEQAGEGFILLVGFASEGSD
jgi:hypothetical protein